MFRPILIQKAKNTDHAQFPFQLTGAYESL